MFVQSHCIIVLTCEGERHVIELQALCACVCVHAFMCLLCGQPFHMAIWVRGVSNTAWTRRQTFLGSGPSHVAVEREC